MRAYHIKNKEIILDYCRPQRSLLAAITTILLLITPPAFAHKLNMFAYVEGNEIFVEGYFTDGKKARNSAITVFDAADNELLRGISDEDGQFGFAIPQQSDMRITVNAGMGHQTEYSLLKDELLDESLLGSTSVTDMPTPAPQTASTTPQPDGPLTPVTAVSLDNSALRSEVERAVGKAIKPLMRELSAMRAEKSMGDIIGGIGFIFGLLGIAMYFKARKDAVAKAQP